MGMKKQKMDFEFQLIWIPWFPAKKGYTYTYSKQCTVGKSCLAMPFHNPYIVCPILTQCHKYSSLGLNLLSNQHTMNLYNDFWLSCMFLNPKKKFRSILIALIHHIWETSRNKLKKHSVAKNCTDLSLFEQIVQNSDLKVF